MILICSPASFSLPDATQTYVYTRKWIQIKFVNMNVPWDDIEKFSLEKKTDSSYVKQSSAKIFVHWEPPVIIIIKIYSLKSIFMDNKIKLYPELYMVSNTRKFYGFLYIFYVSRRNSKNLVQNIEILLANCDVCRPDSSKYRKLNNNNDNNIHIRVKRTIYTNS